MTNINIYFIIFIVYVLFLLYLIMSSDLFKQFIKSNREFYNPIIIKLRNIKIIKRCEFYYIRKGFLNYKCYSGSLKGFTGNSYFWMKYKNIQSVGEDWDMFVLKKNEKMDKVVYLERSE